MLDYLLSFGVTGLLVAVFAVLFVLRCLPRRRGSKAPPYIPSPIPWVGHVVSFGENPIKHLLACKEKYGPVFSFAMFGSEVTYLLGSEASNRFWGSHNDDLNAEDLYRNITVPVFGPGVAFDVPNKVFSEQKRIAKTGLTKARFETYTSLVEHEANVYCQRYENSGSTDLFHDMAEMVIFTATRCLHGKETRDRFDETLAHLYHDLDGGFTPLAWFFPSWVPFPSFLRRDRAHKEIKRRFKEIVEIRRAKEAQTGYGDMLETFLTTKYTGVNDGRSLNEDEISGLMIALLLAGQHTSSTTASWMGFFICTVPGLQEELYEEQQRVLKGHEGPLTLDVLNEMKLLWSVVRETLRLRPPLMQMMRRCRKPFTVEANGKEYVIPVGAQVCVSPCINHRMEEEWVDPDTFDPRRFLHTNEQGETVVTQGEHEGKGGKFKWVPFGAGRHRCIGFEFAQIQIRAVWSRLLRDFEFAIPSGKMPEINFRTMIHTPMDSTVTYKRRNPKK
eukprot:m.36129 g.36129  ORF g.36129 m.36129 type:complete len:502 (+) comp10989_c0_seq1:273-1778(+)